MVGDISVIKSVASDKMDHVSELINANSTSQVLINDPSGYPKAWAWSCALALQLKIPEFKLQVL